MVNMQYNQYNPDWPPEEYYLHESDLTETLVNSFEELVRREVNETEIDKFISQNPVLLTAILDFKNTGHHAAWVIPKLAIRPHVSSIIPGLIPDFIVGGRNSLGITWYVVELKSPKQKLFATSHNKFRLSADANKGLCQVLEYMQFCNKSQNMLRDTLKLKNFGGTDAFLFIGREEETENERAKDLKFAFNNINSHLQIRSYDGLLRCCRRIVKQ